MPLIEPMIAADPRSGRNRPRSADGHHRDPMATYGRLLELLGSLAPDQRAAVIAPPGPILCVAPAGSGKTTTLVARLAWRLAHGSAPDRTCAVTFNRRAATNLRARLAPLTAEQSLPPDAVRVRTFHALGREILLDGGRPDRRVLDRPAVLRHMTGDGLAPASLRRLDDAIARAKLDPHGGSAPPGILRAYQRLLADGGAMDHDDLIVEAIGLLTDERALRDRWRERCATLLVDEIQDLDHAQWRLARLLVSPADDLFLVGDDDQTIYAWRLADARRMLGLAAELPGVRRVDLHTNYRCPAAVVERAVELVVHNRERLAKRVRAGPDGRGSLTLVADPGDDVARARQLLGRWAGDLHAAPPSGAPSHAILARTTAELAPYAAVAVELGLPYWADRDDLSFDPDDCASIPGWAFGLAVDGVAPSKPALRAALAAAEARRTELRRADAALQLATIHATKGLEFDTVACVGLDDGRFPNVRALQEAEAPARQLEEERRLAYVAWTRARRSLELIYDPGGPSQFIREAFHERELRLADAAGSLAIAPHDGWRG
jgi:superfamily I DNA/RNA helicase